jgi:hypothetical protein
MNVSFSQSIEDNRSFQFDEIVSQKMESGEFMICVGLSYNPSSEQVFILKRTKDSLCVTNYASDVKNHIGDVYSLFVNNYVPFVKTVDTLYDAIKQGHDYKPYTKEMLNGGYFFLTFYENGQLQIFNSSGASQNQLKNIAYIIKCLNGFSASPLGGHNSRKKYLDVQDWSELLKYLKSNSLDSPPM